MWEKIIFKAGQLIDRFCDAIEPTRPGDKILSERAIASELQKIKSHRMMKALRAKSEDKVDDTLFRMLDVANVTAVSTVLNWVCGRIKHSPIELMLGAIEKRKENKKKGNSREMLIAEWLGNHNIDKDFLTAIISKVAEGQDEINPTNMTDENKPVEAPAETPATPEPAPAEPAVDPSMVPEDMPTDTPPQA